MENGFGGVDQAVAFGFAAMQPYRPAAAFSITGMVWIACQIPNSSGSMSIGPVSRFGRKAEIGVHAVSPGARISQ